MAALVFGKAKPAFRSWVGWEEPLPSAPVLAKMPGSVPSLGVEHPAEGREAAFEMRRQPWRRGAHSRAGSRLPR